MKIAYCSLLLPEEKKIAERAKGHLPGISLHKFTKAIISGLDENPDADISVFNVINTLNYPKFPEIVFKREQWSHNGIAKDLHIGYINLFGIKYMTQEKNLFNALNQWASELNGERFILCVHHNYYPMLRAALHIKRKYGDQVVTCLISGDIPGKFGRKSQYKNSLKERMIERMNQDILSMVKGFDSFILQTKYMAEGFGVQEKPVHVMECAYLPSAYSLSAKAESYRSKDKKIIFYAGSLRVEYDALHLIKAFRLIENQDYELWLAGGGNAVETIKNTAEKDGRIKYLGFISPQEVYDRQQVATVLVSPRKADHTFVKYSFPSKTMECLASGKPYIAHKLPCETEEYRKYIQYPDNESDEALAQKIIEICELEEEKRIELGLKGKRFIETEKSPAIMCRDVVSFWKSIINKR